MSATRCGATGSAADSRDTAEPKTTNLLLRGGRRVSASQYGAAGSSTASEDFAEPKNNSSRGNAEASECARLSEEPQDNTHPALARRKSVHQKTMQNQKPPIPPRNARALRTPRTQALRKLHPSAEDPKKRAIQRSLRTSPEEGSKPYGGDKSQPTAGGLAQRGRRARWR